jgi:hypothetical protein
MGLELEGTCVHRQKEILVVNEDLPSVNYAAAITWFPAHSLARKTRTAPVFKNSVSPLSGPAHEKMVDERGFEPPASSLRTRKNLS